MRNLLRCRCRRWWRDCSLRWSNSRTGTGRSSSSRDSWGSWQGWSSGGGCEVEQLERQVRRDSSTSSEPPSSDPSTPSPHRLRDGGTGHCGAAWSSLLVCDNYATHKTDTIQRWLAAHPRFQVHFVPTSSSWLNQVERWFAEFTTKLLHRGVHTSVPALEADIRVWIDTWNEDPKPVCGPRPRTKSKSSAPSPDDDAPAATRALPGGSKGGRWGHNKLLSGPDYFIGRHGTHDACRHGDVTRVPTGDPLGG